MFTSADVELHYLTKIICELTKIANIMNQTWKETQIPKGCHFAAHPVCAITIKYNKTTIKQFATWDHRVIPTQVNAPHLNPSHAGRYLIYLPRRDGRLS